MTGKNYIETTKLAYLSPLRDTPERKIMSLMPMSMLAGFALELMFKAWLLESGRSSKAVRAFGHDVTKLYAEAKVDGFPGDARYDELVMAFENGHKDFTFRYIDDGDQVSDINWEAAFSVLDRLDVEVDTKVGASASKGLAPGH